RHLDLKEDGFGIETEITAKSVYENLSVLNVPIYYVPRLGKSKFNPLKDGLVVFRSLFKYYFLFKVLYFKKVLGLGKGDILYRNRKNKVKCLGFFRNFSDLVSEYTRYF
ncbi:MAG: hypothetical protein U9O53_01545, partial [archaeon]|nr:hypothetical protein [archaeon]